MRILFFNWLALRIKSSISIMASSREFSMMMLSSLLLAEVMKIPSSSGNGAALLMITIRFSRVKNSIGAAPLALRMLLVSSGVNAHDAFLPVWLPTHTILKAAPLLLISESIWRVPSPLLMYSSRSRVFQYSLFSMSWSMLKSGSFNSMLNTISLPMHSVLTSFERSVISTGHFTFILSDIYFKDMF